MLDNKGPRAHPVASDDPETDPVTDAGDTRRMTYAQLGAARGISAASAKRLALRHKWPKADSNDGLARVYVPASSLATPPVTTPAISLPVAGDASLVTASGAERAQGRAEGEVAALRDALARESEQRERAEGERDTLAGELIRERERAARLGGENGTLREVVARQDQRIEQEVGRADRERDRAEAAKLGRDAARAAAEAAHAARQAAEAAAEAARRELAEVTAGGPLRRVLRAFAFRRQS
jgi:hypothetical protein